ncbi:hypothetical protein [Mesorhizobium sp. BHbdii]
MTRQTATIETMRTEFGIRPKQSGARSRPMERTRRDGSAETKKEIEMNRFKTYMAAASALACFVAPASAEWPVGGNGKSLNGLRLNSLTSNSLTSNSLTSNGLGVYALNGVQADGIVLVKSLAKAGGSIIDPNDRSVIDPNFRSIVDPNVRGLPAVQKGNVRSSTASKKSNGLPSGQHGTGNGAGTNHDRPTPSPRR